MPITAEQQQEIQERNTKLEADKLDPDKIELEQDNPQTTYEEASNELEVQARASGWVPLEEWSGSANDWVDAKEFINRGELMGRIRKQTNHINNLREDINGLKSALKELGEHNKKIAEAERKKVLAELKQARREALEDRDYERVDEIEEHMDEVKSEVYQEVKVPEESQAEPVANPEVEAWLEVNQWYTQDPILQGATNAIIQNLVQEDPSYETNPKALLAEAKAQVMKELPHKFGEPDETPAPRRMTAEPTSTPARKQGKTKYTSKHLNAEQAKAAKVFADSGALTVDEYVAQLAEMGELDIQKGS